MRIGNRVLKLLTLISTVVSKLKNFSRSRAIVYAAKQKVVISETVEDNVDIVSLLLT